jgi:hypothetical protein
MSLRDILIYQLWFLPLLSLIVTLLTLRCILRVNNHLQLFWQQLQDMRSNGLYIVEPILYELVD